MLLIKIAATHKLLHEKFAESHGSIIKVLMNSPKVKDVLDAIEKETASGFQLYVSTSYYTLPYPTLA